MQLQDRQELLASVVFFLIPQLPQLAEEEPIISYNALALLHKILRDQKDNLLGQEVQLKILSSLRGAIVIIPDTSGIFIHQKLPIILKDCKTQGIPVRLGLSHGTLEVLEDADGLFGFVGIPMNVAARLSTSDKNKGVLYDSTYTDHVRPLPTSRSNDPLHPRFGREAKIRGKEHDPVFICKEPEDSNLVLSKFDNTILSEFSNSSNLINVNGIAIAYDLPKFSQGDRSELSKRFRSVIDAIKSIKTRQIFSEETHFYFSPGGDGGILVLQTKLGIALGEYISIAFELIEKLKIESGNKDPNIDVKSRVGIHYGSVSLYTNAEGFQRPTGLTCFIADEIASDDLAKQKGGIVVTNSIKGLLFGGSEQRFQSEYESLKPLHKGTIQRYVKIEQKTQATSPPDPLKESPDRERAKLTPPQNIPRSGVIKFVGRDKALSKLHQQLQQSQRIAITAITGMGGVGKTELALQYAQEYWRQQTYPGGVCWLQARRADLATQTINFGRAQLDLNPPEDVDLLTQIDYCWQHWFQGEVLVVFDDVVKYEDIEDYLPPADPRFKVLITTRLKWLGESFQQLNLEVLDETAALELLALFVGESWLREEREQARAICADLGFLPLGLELVGRYLKRKPDLSLTEMRQRLGLGHHSLQQCSKEMTAKRGVAAAFDLSWLELDERQKRLACLLSLFALAPIPWSRVEQCLPSEDTEELEDIRDEVLVNLSLLERKDKGTYQLYQLIREFLKGKLEKTAWAEEFKKGFCQVMVAVAKEIPDTPTREQILAATSVIPHLAEAATALTNWLSNEDLIWPFVGLGRFYQGQGAYNQAEPWYEQALAMTKRLFEGDHPDVALSLNNLAVLYYSQGRYSDAELLYTEALAMTKRLFEGDHPSVASSLNNLAALYKSQGRYSDAEPLYSEALAMTKRLWSGGHTEVVRSLHNLAVLYESQGRYSEAEPLLSEALAMTKRLWLGDHPYVVVILNSLGGLYHDQGRYSEAELLLSKALAMTKRLWSGDHSYVVVILNSLGRLYHDQGRYSEAEPLLSEALVMTKHLWSGDHPYVARSLNSLGRLYHDQGRYSEAEPLLSEALAMTKRLWSGDHPYVADSLDNLAVLYHSQERYSEAEPLYSEALAMTKRLRSGDHLYVAISLKNLAFLYRDQGRYGEAESLFQETLMMYERLLGVNHPFTVKVRENLALLQN